MLTGIDTLTDAELLEKAKAYFLKKTEGKMYLSPIPKYQMPPLPQGRRPLRRSAEDKNGMASRRSQAR